MKNIISSLKVIANGLDNKGLISEASSIDNIIIKIAMDPYQYINYDKAAIPIDRYPRIDYLKVLDDAKEEFKLNQNRSEVMDVILSQIADSLNINNINDPKHANLRMNIENIVTRAEQLNERQEDLQDKS